MDSASKILYKILKLLNFSMLQCVYTISCCTLVRRYCAAVPNTAVFMQHVHALPAVCVQLCTHTCTQLCVHTAALSGYGRVYTCANSYQAQGP
jgi:hypothetical protein